MAANLESPQTSMVTCPTCKGNKIVVRHVGPHFRTKREQRCMACGAQGVVDATRACATCGKWTDLCICRSQSGPRPALIGKVPSEPIQKPVHQPVAHVTPV